MFEPFRTRDNVSEALQSLLQLYPHEVNARSKVILTTFPGLWDREETREHTKLIDLSALLGSRAVQTASESNIEAGVSQQFVDAGWPRDSVITQYRPSLKSSFVTDIAVFGLDRSWQVSLCPFSSSRSLGRKIAKYKTIHQTRPSQLYEPVALMRKRGPHRVDN